MSWLVAQADYLRFLYGLLLGLAALGCTVVHGRDRTGVRWEWLAAFGVLHGLHEWVELIPAPGGWGALSLGLWVASWGALAAYAAPGHRRGRAPARPRAPGRRIARPRARARDGDCVGSPRRRARHGRVFGCRQGNRMSFRGVILC